MHNKQLRWLFFAVALTLYSCSDQRPAPAVGTASDAPLESAAPVNPALAELARHQIELAEQASLELQRATAQLLAGANADTLAAAHQAWREAAPRLEALHLFSRLGALPHSKHKALAQLQYNLAAWPIAPGYLDAVGEHPYSGLVFDISLPLSAQLLREQHGLTADTDATTGIYAIEFLLFGEQNVREPLLFRPITELSEQHRQEGYEDPSELPGNRRRQLLSLQTQLLVEDLQRLRHYWADQQLQITDDDFLEMTSAMLREHILQVARLQRARQQLQPQPAQNGQQLARRIKAQLEGWQQVLQMSALANVPELMDVSNGALEQLQELQQQAATAQADTQSELWLAVYQSLRKAISILPRDVEQSTPQQGEAAPQQPQG